MITGKDSAGPRNLYFKVSGRGFKSNLRCSVADVDGLGDNNFGKSLEHS
jgi:hypothetical protein